jgi:hypothetical protein
MPPFSCPWRSASGERSPTASRRPARFRSRPPSVAGNVQRGRPEVSGQRKSPPALSSPVRSSPRAGTLTNQTSSGTRLGRGRSDRTVGDLHQDGCQHEGVKEEASELTAEREDDGDAEHPVVGSPEEAMGRASSRPEPHRAIEAEGGRGLTRVQCRGRRRPLMRRAVTLSGPAVPSTSRSPFQDR